MTPTSTGTAGYPEDVIEAAEACYYGSEELDGGQIIDKIAKALLTERQRSQWQPISTYPMDGTDALVCVTYNISADEWETLQWVDWCAPAYPWHVYSNRIDIPFPPTHWMPLPAPPSEAK